MDLKHTAELKLLATEHHMLKDPGILVICLVNPLKGLLFEGRHEHYSLQMPEFGASCPLSLSVFLSVNVPAKEGKRYLLLRCIQRKFCTEKD
jgi:hypothetical protein